MREGKLSGELAIDVAMVLKKVMPQSFSDPDDTKGGEGVCAKDYFVREK